MKTSTIFFSLFLCAATWAETPVEQPGLAWVAIKMIAGVCVIVGLIVAMGFMAKRMNLGGMTNQKYLQVMASLPISNREKIVLLHAKNKHILIGVSPGNIRTLHVFDENQPLDDQIDKKNDENPEAKSLNFSNFLNDIVKAGDKKSG